MIEIKHLFKNQKDEKVYACYHPKCFKTSQEDEIYTEEIDNPNEDKKLTVCEKHVDYSKTVKKLE